MAQLKDLIVNGDAYFGDGVAINGDLKADTYNGRSILTASAMVTPSQTGTGIVTEQYLAYALANRNDYSVGSSTSSSSTHTFTQVAWGTNQARNFISLTIPSNMKCTQIYFFQTGSTGNSSGRIDAVGRVIYHKVDNTLMSLNYTASDGKGWCTPSTYNNNPCLANGSTVYLPTVVANQAMMYVICGYHFV